MDQKKKVAIIGTNGIPARYGGFETLAENLVEKLSGNFDFTVYCSNIYKKKERNKTYKNARLIYIPLKANGAQSLFFDFLSFLHALFTANSILFLGPTPSGIITLLNIFFKRKLIVNHGGLNEWEREKYSSFEKKWAKINHQIAAKNASINIADNTILQHSIKKTFNSESIVIRYGGDCGYIKENESLSEKYKFTKDKYFLCVARAQVDNNIHVLIDAISKSNSYPLVIISNWEVSEYGKRIKKEAINNDKVILLDAIYNLDELNFIRANCFLYIHSHSFCGTAPSLVEAMNFNIPIICFDVPTNRETTHNKSIYFSNSEMLSDILNNLDPASIEKIRSDLFNIAKKNYTWSVIASNYKEIL
jgi:glycosyltransferase involved in cell wall biosynthesis